jgi:hypothetical protein
MKVASSRHMVSLPGIRRLQRSLFTRECLMESAWYRERLRTKQMRDMALWTRHVHSIERFLASGNALRGEDIDARLGEARRQLARVRDPGYLKELAGGLGADPSCGEAG